MSIAVTELPVYSYPMNLEYYTSHTTAAGTGHALTSCGKASEFLTSQHGSMNKRETSVTGVQTIGRGTFLVFKDFPHKGTRG